MSVKKINVECCILGSGPAGLATGIELVRNEIKDIVIIDRNSIAGGLSRTEVRDNYRFDVGPHRFFTKNLEINQLWHDTLKKDFIPVNRLTRIYYNNKFFNYPIKATDVLTKMNIIELTHSLISYAGAQLKKKASEDTFEDWVSKRFGKKLYNTFFKTYTEKVWGIPCNEIGAEWAAQRIKGLDIIKVIQNSFNISGKQKIKTLVDQFDYPVLGAGQMYEAWLDECAKAGVNIYLSTTVKKIVSTEDRIKELHCIDKDGQEIIITANHFFSSIPLTHFFNLQENISDKIRKAVEALYYREHITVDLLIDGTEVFPDQWIYIHDPNVHMARIANYNNFSVAMVNNENKTGLSVEYFVFQTDDIWKMSDEDIVELAKSELEHLKLVKSEKVLKSWVVRETESYPTYYLGYKEPYNILKNTVDNYTNMLPIGRGGMYKYNNQDHSIMSGLLAARNYIKPSQKYKLWDINIDADYHESASRESVKIDS